MLTCAQVTVPLEVGFPGATVDPWDLWVLYSGSLGSSVSAKSVNRQGSERLHKRTNKQTALYLDLGIL